MTKYRAVKVILDNICFSSKREAARYGELKLLQRAGQIADLILQPKFPIFINGVQVFQYVADFSYTEDGEKVIEDCKGFRTPMYRLKKKCVQAFYNVKIKET